MYEELRQGSRGEREVPHSKVYIRNEVLQYEDLLTVDQNEWINDTVPYFVPCRILCKGRRPVVVARNPSLPFLVHDHMFLILSSGTLILIT